MHFDGGFDTGTRVGVGKLERQAKRQWKELSL
jgi:hypothetical protein